MPYPVDEHALREEALRLTCARMGWDIELGRRVRTLAPRLAPITLAD
jgi:hypothetical protein